MERRKAGEAMNFRGNCHFARNREMYCREARASLTALMRGCRLGVQAVSNTSDLSSENPTGLPPWSSVAPSAVLELSSHSSTGFKIPKHTFAQQSPRTEGRLV